MTRAKRFVARAVCALAMVVVCAYSARGRADRRVVRVAVGDVAGHGLAEAMRDELGRNPEVRVVAPQRAELVLEGTLTQLRRRVVDGELEVRCEVSVIVSDARGGALRAMLTGRAGARGGNDVDRLSRNALVAAVRGALRPLASTGARLAGDVASSRHER